MAKEPADGVYNCRQDDVGRAGGARPSSGGAAFGVALVQLFDCSPHCGQKAPGFGLCGFS